MSISVRRSFVGSADVTSREREAWLTDSASAWMTTLGRMTPDSSWRTFGPQAAGNLKPPR